MQLRAAQKHGIDPSISAGLIETESGWDPAAIVTAGVVVLDSLCLLLQGKVWCRYTTHLCQCPRGTSDTVQHR